MSAESVKSVVKSALRPGVELGVEDGSVNIVARLSDIARGEVAGYNASVQGSYRQLFPRLARKDYLKLAYTELPDSPVSLREVLQSIPGLRDQDIFDFSQARRLARQEMEDGSYRDIVVPNLKNLVTEMDLADYDELDGIELEQIPDLASRLKTRTYTLTQVMSDMDVKQKYKLSARVYFTGERLAATDAPAAAQVFQDAMNVVQDHTRVRVVPGLLAVDNVQAANTIRMMAYGTPQISDSVNCDVVVGKKVFLYAPESSDVAWHVVAPVNRMPEAMEVYRIVCAQGPVLPSGLLAVDLVQLKIDIFDGESYMEPVMQFNAARSGASTATAGLSGMAAREMTSRQRSLLASMTDKLLPILNSQGMQLATAIRVTDRHVLVNDHVQAADANASIAGRRMSMSCRVARDVWSVENPGEGTPWVYRDPEVGEAAIILYIAGGVVSCTSPVIVESVKSDTVMTSGSSDVVRGVSGGALVGLRDFALFGVHSASVGASLLNYRFGPTQLEEVVGSDASASISRVDESESFAAVLMKRFDERGLRSTFQAAYSSVIPLWFGSTHVGMALLDGGKAFTTANSHGTYTSQDGSHTYVFGHKQGYFYEAACPWSVKKIPLRRKPRLGEKVFIVGYDDDVYVTNETEVAHVFTGDKGFVLKFIEGLDKPITGGAVIAGDGAVVGLAGLAYSFNTPVGLGLTCHPLPQEFGTVTPNARKVIADKFPYLQMSLWPDDVLEEIFTHPSAGGYKGSRIFNVGNKPLAVLGDAFLRYLNGKILREHDVPHAEWAHYMQQLQSNAALAPVAHKFGLDACLIMGKGVQLPDNSRGHADLVEALIGAAAMLEPESVVMKLASDMKLIHDMEEEASVVNVSEAAVD